MRREVEDLVVAQLAFALEEAAGDLARGVGLLLVVDAEREEALARLGLLRSAHRDEHDGVARSDQHRAACLLCDATCLQGDDLVADPNLLSE